MWKQTRGRNLVDMISPAISPLSKRLRAASEEAATVTLRVAQSSADSAVIQLAELDTASPPAAPLLVAELNGRPRAALSLVDGAVVADALLRLRAALDGHPARDARAARTSWSLASRITRR
jgi:hypothetical protein